MFYVCLSTECAKSKTTEIIEYNKVNMFCEDIAFYYCLFNKRFNDNILIYSPLGIPYVSPKCINVVIYCIT